VRGFSVVYIIVIAFFSCTSTDRESGNIPTDVNQDDDSSIAFKMNELLNKSFPKGNVRWPSFFMIDSSKQSASDAEPFEGDDDFYKDYATILRWSADSVYVLDLNSYGLIPEKDEKGNTHLTGGDPEVGVGLIDRQAGKRIRLFYMGPHGGIYDGLWLDSTNVAFIGKVEDLTSMNNKYDTLVWIYNRKDSIKKLYKFSP